MFQSGVEEGQWTERALDKRWLLPICCGVSVCFTLPTNCTNTMPSSHIPWVTNPCAMDINCSLSHGLYGRHFQVMASFSSPLFYFDFFYISCLSLKLNFYIFNHFMSYGHLLDGNNFFFFFLTCQRRNTNTPDIHVMHERVNIVIFKKTKQKKVLF